MEETFKISKEMLVQIIEKAYDDGYCDGYDELYNQEFIGSNIEDIKPVRGKEDVVNEILTGIIEIKKAINKAVEKIDNDYTSIGVIRKIVHQIIVDKLGVDDAEVTDGASFRNDLGADSLDTVELIMEFESYFRIEIRDDDAEKVRTVGDAVDALYKFLNKRR